MAFVRVPPDGAGKKVYTKSHTVGADNVEAQMFHQVDGANPLNIQAVDQYGAASISFFEGPPSLSGFGALNVSNKSLLASYAGASRNNDKQFAITLANGGTSTYDDVSKSTILQTTAVSGSRVARCSHFYHPYIPGSSNKILMSLGCGDTGTANNIRRWGAFDASDGVYFELDGTTLYAVIRSSTTGSVVETRVAQSSWNGDMLDGNGLSGETLDVSKLNIYWIDYQWLGAGRVRFGVFGEDGKRLVCHSFYNANANTVPYMRTGTLPIGTENVNTGLASQGVTLREVCIAVYTEGEFEDYVYDRSADLTVPFLSYGAGETPVSAIRAAPTLTGNFHNPVTTFFDAIAVYTEQPCKLTLYDDVTVVSGTWSAVSSGSSLEKIGLPVLTGLDHPYGVAYIESGVDILNLSDIFEINDLGIRLNADGTSRPWALTVQPLGNYTGVNMQIDITYKELWA